MLEWKFELGDRVRDRVSGFKGIVTSRTEYLNGCQQYGIDPPADSVTGKMNEGYRIDGQQLELVDKGLNQTEPVKKRSTGGATTAMPLNRN
jgi:hypothetical protein